MGAGAVIPNVIEQVNAKGIMSICHVKMRRHTSERPVNHFSQFIQSVNIFMKS